MITLRPYQEETLDRIWSYFSNGNKGNPLIAMPTGTGKSCIPAVFIERIMRTYPDQRFLVMTHVAELIKQNYEVMQYAWPDAPVGIYSAGLKKKQPFYPIVFGGIQSMAKDPARFGHRDIIFVDEAHLISDEESSQYITFLSTMKLINPNVKIIGMTATPFRMGMGLLTEGTIFTDIIHDLTSCDEFNRLIAEGYMCPLVPKRTHTELDVSNVGMSKGDFVMSQLEHAVDVDKITFGALKEAVEYGHNRKSWLIFSSGIEHAEHIATMLGTFGIDCAAVHSKQKSEYNDAAIKAFKSNSLRAISSYSKLTTGFNHPEIDLICDLRPTMSIPLHIQKLGRGTRTANGKENCLVLDFGRNVPRLGPINDPAIPKKRVEGNGDVPVKICEACGTYNHTKVRFCTNCGNEFEFQIKYFKTAGTDAILKSDLPIIEMFDVDRVIYNRRTKDGKPPHIRATYYCGLRSFNEYVFPENNGYTKKLFNDWWKKRHIGEPPIHCEAVLDHMKELRTPKRIRVWINKKFPEVMSVEF